MTAYQTTYSSAPAKGLPGQVANTELANIISRTVESAAGIGFGQPAFRGSGDHGVVVGGTFAATGAGSEAAGNVGTGTITDEPTISAGAKPGRYKAVLLATSGTAAFVVEDPDGIVIGHGNVASAFTGGGLSFTISNAGTMTIGDTFYVDVTYTANASFIGLAVLDPAVPPSASTPDAYPQYFTGAFMTKGQMYVTAGASVVDGGDVYWTAAFMFRDEIKQAIGLDVVEVMVDVGNKTIGVFVGAYEAIRDQWSNLPVFFSAIGKMAWNSFVESFEGPALTIDTPWGSWQSGGLDLSGVKAQLSDAEKASFGQSTVAFDDAFNRDYIGGLTTAVGDLWTNAEGAKGAMADLMDAAGGGGTATDAGSGAGRKNPYADLIRGAEQFIAAQELEAQAIGMTAQAANALRYEQEMLNQAANDNIALTAAQKEQIAGLAASMASAEEKTRSLKAAYDFAKGTFTGFFEDMRGGLKDGMSWWESFANAATNALNKVIDKAFEMLATGIFDLIMGASGGGWISAVASLFGFAKGGAFNNGLQAFAHGGVVNRPTVFPMARGMGLMGEAGPEAIMPLKRGRDGRLGVEAQNDNRSGGVVEVRVSLDDDLLNVRIDNRAAGVSAQVVQGGLKAYDATSPARSAEQQARYG